MPTPATGSIIINSAGGDWTDGALISLDEGKGQTLSLEFTDGAADGGDVAAPLSAERPRARTKSANSMSGNRQCYVDDADDIGITASVDGTTVTLTNDTDGSDGNQTTQPTTSGQMRLSPA